MPILATGPLARRLGHGLYGGKFRAGATAGRMPGRPAGLGRPAGRGDSAALTRRRRLAAFSPSELPPLPSARDAAVLPHRRRRHLPAPRRPARVGASRGPARVRCAVAVSPGAASNIARKRLRRGCVMNDSDALTRRAVRRGRPPTPPARRVRADGCTLEAGATRTAAT